MVIVALLPNPSGQDAGHEKVILANQSNSEQQLIGWHLEDDDDGSFALSGVSIPAREGVTVTLDDGLRLGNSGDEVRLVRQGGQRVQAVEHDDAENGRFVVP